MIIDRKTSRSCSLVVAVSLAMVVSTSSGCSSSTSTHSTPPPASVCSPDSTEKCVGPGDCIGTSTCNSAGSAMGACTCPTTTVHDASTGMDVSAASCVTPDPGSFGVGQCEYAACYTPATPYFCPAGTNNDAGQTLGQCYPTVSAAYAGCGASGGFCFDCTGTTPATIAVAGFPCTSDVGELVCGNDQSTILYCGVVTDGGVGAGSTFVKAGACPTGQTCETQTGNSSVQCGAPTTEFNVTFAVLGAPCAAEQSGACSFDYSKSLTCNEGVWSVMEECGTGASHCDVLAPGSTDMSGDTCPASDTVGCVGCL